MAFSERDSRQATKMKQRLQVLEERERLFQTVLDSFPDAIEIIDQDFNVVYLNAAAASRTQKSAESQVGEKCHQVFYNREDPCCYCPAKKAFEGGEPGYVLRENVSIRNSEPCFEELLLLPVKINHQKNGNEVKWVVEIAKDVTREKEMEQQIISSDRLVAIGEMAAAVAHEFNNPLGIILGFSQDLLTEVEPVDPRFNSLKIIEEEARRCKKIMRDLMEFGRPTPAQFTLIDPGELIRRGADLISSQAQKAGVQTRIEISKGLPKIRADSQQVTQVLVNLFFNAIEAMPEGGTLTIGCAAKDVEDVGNSGNSLAPLNNEVVVSVSDTGFGIAPNVLPKIFRTFFTTKQKKGMGLGLSVCESIMKGHGGRIAVESTPGKGTTFYLYFRVEERREENRVRR
ncbi:MAG: PAS domain-containing protein [Nitrospirae bacterium]|nr:PAS domain-containing protein [Nitrospirota bacterium]